MAGRRGVRNGRFAALGFFGFTGWFTIAMLGKGGLVGWGGQEGGQGAPERTGM